MAKKGGVQQLQAEINTDEELYKLLDKSGLILIDVYSEWCGPCVGMLNSLKKIKLELGGDSLHLAICKSDTVDAMIRFRNKSEPTWLFVTNGRAFNIMFGTNLPKLMKMITVELSLLGKPRDSFAITEPLPEEQERYRKIFEAVENARILEETAHKQKRLEYLNHCTFEILGFCPDIGITIFGPQVNRDHIKKILEVAESHRLSCKDRKFLTISAEQAETLHYACTNPIDPEVLEQLYNKELFMCYWKVEEVKHSVEEAMQSFCNEITQPQQAKDEFGNPNPDSTIPPLLRVLEVKINAPKLTPPVSNESIEVPQVDDVNMMKLKEVDVENVEDHAEIETKSKSGESIKISKSSSFSSKVFVPAVWTPGNRKTTAAAIYVFFRHQTVNFLPPDPIPEPNHLIIAFEAYKKRDVADVMVKFEEDILSYGYFTTFDPDTAELIATSTNAYSLKTAKVSDKLVIKVAKKTNDALLALAAHGTCYISPNTEVGKCEALKFFPDGYISQEPVEDNDSKTSIIETISQEIEGKHEEEDETPPES